jgi:hypothetical protein
MRIVGSRRGGEICVYKESYDQMREDKTGQKTAENHADTIGQPRQPHRVCAESRRKAEEESEDYPEATC